jgi:hypothetical protein
MKLQWSKNDDDAWVGKRNGVVFAGIVKRVLPEGRRFAVYVYYWNTTANAHHFFGLCKEMKGAQELARIMAHGA